MRLYGGPAALDRALFEVGEPVAGEELYVEEAGSHALYRVTSLRDHADVPIARFEREMDEREFLAATSGLDDDRDGGERID